ncbi:MAG: MotA/TolQ/ExbB proton channel family protein [Pirellulaceae bacterium]|nr:MotA/TolQ/ExbB proton channel family protein [Planctomycetales bacterium]
MMTAKRHSQLDNDTHPIGSAARRSLAKAGIAAALVLLLVSGGRATGQTDPLPPNIQIGPSASGTIPPTNDTPIPHTPGGINFSAAGLFSALRDGGPIMIPIAGCSFLLFVFIFERAISLRRGRVIPRHFVRRFIQQLQEDELDQQEALVRCRENRSPVAEVFAAGVMKWDKPSVEVEQAIIDAGERAANGLRSYLRLFNGISTISPLLGLLGTVSGMISAFNCIAAADAMGRPELLATGISQALLTTAAGLTVAIPAIVAHLFFSSRVDRLVMDIDSLGQQVVNAVACDTYKEKPARKKPRTRAA